jgi:hypothetical protein
MNRHLPSALALLSFILIAFPSGAEEIKVKIADSIELSKDKAQSAPMQLAYNDAALISLDRDTRFFTGIELELSAPQLWLNSQGSLAVLIYANPEKLPAKGIQGVQEISVTQLRMDTLANKIQTVYQIPIKQNHNLRNTPYVTVLSNVVPPQDFPLIFRIMPIVRDISEDLQNLRFHLTVKPILSDEGAVKINVRYPQALPNKPYTALIDDMVTEHPEDEHLLKEGPHHLMVISNDYRNESRRFILERGKTIDLHITLQDLTPLILFETPDNARIFLDNVRFAASVNPRPIEPGPHEVKIQVSDYTIIKSLYARKGKTYRIAFTVDLDISEE